MKLCSIAFWHGGIVSVSSSNTTNCPQLSQVYVPAPGFSPVDGITSSPLFYNDVIILQIDKLWNVN